jgi:ferredoxin
MLAKIRIAIAAIIWTAITLLFLDFTGSLNLYFGWIAKMQLVPAILAQSIIILAVLLACTLLFGRIYCSILCPLGICQDIASAFSSRIKKKSYSFKQNTMLKKIIKYSIMGLFALSFFLGFNFIAVLIEPYSAFGRMVTSLLSPLYLLVNNFLAFCAEKMDSYAFYTVDIRLKSISALVVAIVTFVTIFIFAARTGRGYCNTICPVGSLLGILAKFSFFKVRLNKDKCKDCKICVGICKSACIDLKSGTIDYTRCVSCFNCIAQCPKGAFSFSAKADKLTAQAAVKDASKRNFISSLFLLGLGLFTARSLYAYDFDGGLAPIERKKKPKRRVHIIPAGALNHRIFNKKCTGCQLCVSSCPNNVLRPTGLGPRKLSRFMQPEISYERGYCRPECVKCSTICPTGAIRPITPEEKSAVQTGIARWNQELCVVLTDNVNCDLCSVRCPTAAISMIAHDPGSPASRKIPMIDDNRCIGCGACEHLCPSRPFSAIYVEGIDTHRTI